MWSACTSVGICICVCVCVYVCAYACMYRREFVTRGMRWAGNIKLTLHSLSFYNNFFYSLGKKLRKEVWYVFQKSETRKKIHKEMQEDSEVHLG